MESQEHRRSAPPRPYPARRSMTRRVIRSVKATLTELKGLIELLVSISIMIWGLMHVLSVLFVQAR